MAVVETAAILKSILAFSQLCMNKDYLLIFIVTIMSIGANLPDRFVELSGIDRKLLVIGLLLVVTIALVRYSKFVLVLTVVILAAGANLPQEVASTLNIEPRILMIALVAMVLFSLANRFIKLPSGLDQKQGFASEHGTRALFRAIANHRIPIVRAILDSGVNIDARSRQGYTALMIAASHGYDEIVGMLLSNGADLTPIDANGRNALQLARESGQKGCIKLLIDASRATIETASDALPAT
jgi:hypothetical protein